MNEAQIVMDIAIGVNAHFLRGTDEVKKYFEGQDRIAPTEDLWAEVLRYGPFFDYRPNDELLITFQVQINCFSSDMANIYGSTQIAADFAKRARETMFFETLDECAECTRLAVLEKGRIEQRGGILTTIVQADYLIVYEERGV